MAAIARDVSNFTLPATQNTAPVHEYRCLYTHDVRKKAKKWHDGSARFHTFNKRVMVYDDTKSYVGDLHYRGDEEFGEGIELHLDRGVLVEVGERLGETQTDLTGIVHKPHADNGISASSINAQAKPIQRVIGLNGQGRPKSLTELLGTPQSRKGRAKLQHTSPFEQRQALLEVRHVERPLKKQKIMLGKENDKVVEQVIRPQPLQESLSFGNGFTSPTTHRSRVRPRTVDQVVTAPSNNDQPVIDISSDEESPNSKTSLTERSQNFEATSVLRHVENSSLLARPTSKVDSTNRQPRRAKPSPKRQAPGPRSSSSALPSPVNSAISANSRPRTQMSSLKMVSQKPRRKLMYKALLPAGSADQILETISEISEVHNVVDKTPSMLGRDSDSVARSSPAVPNQVLEFEEFEQLFSPTRLSPLHHVPTTTPQRSTLPSRTTEPSPLFVSQTGSQRSPSPTRAFVEDDFRIPSTQEPVAIDGKSNNPDPREIERSVDMSQPDSPCFPQPPSRFRATVQNTSTLMLPPRAPRLLDYAADTPALVQHLPSPTTGRVFARSLSENDSPLSCDPRTTPSRATLPPVEESPTNIAERFSPLHPPSLTTLQPMHNTTPSKSSLQRSRSDTAAVISMTAAPLALPAASDEQGPWTKLEAFVLFDTWPACKLKNKPVFEPLLGLDDIDDVMADSDGDNEGTSFVLPPARRPPVLIRSARSVLRDG